MNKHALMAGLMLGCATLVTAAPDIFPKPQQVNLRESYTQITRVQIEKRRPDSKGGMWERLPADNVGAYAIEITDGTLTVWANSDIPFTADTRFSSPRAKITTACNGTERFKYSPLVPHQGVPNPNHCPCF